MTTASSASTSGQIGADATQFLTSQHRQVESLWSMVEGAGASTAPGREGPARQIVTLLSQHDAIETQLLYPELRDVGGDEGKRLSDHALEEHQQVREMLKDVDRADTFDQQAYATLAKCIAAVQHHVTEEEETIFPLLRQRCNEQRLLELGSKMAKMMDTAPTHPHPSTPDSKLGATVAGAVTGAVDRMRDAAKGDH